MIPFTSCFQVCCWKVVSHCDSWSFDAWPVFSSLKTFSIFCFYPWYPEIPWQCLGIDSYAEYSESFQSEDSRSLALNTYMIFLNSSLFVFLLVRGWAYWTDSLMFSYLSCYPYLCSFVLIFRRVPQQKSNNFFIPDIIF